MTKTQRPSGAFRLRAVRLEDIEDILAIEEQCFTAERFSRAQLRYLIRRETVWTGVIEEDKRVVAYLTMLFRANTQNARFYSLAVSPAYRRHGLARKLLLAAERAAKREGKAYLSLEIRQKNAGARKLYESIGFSVQAALPGYYPDGGDGLRMTKPLSS